MRVQSPARSPSKFGMPAAPLFATMPVRPASSAKRRIAGRQVWVLAKRSTSAVAKTDSSQGRLPGSSSASMPKRQPASESASPWTTPMRQSATS
ncbi:MAG: hypothetical protein KGN16_23330 [Burkholderiales bacterium]|nr:hypothetical protein [Burkholderiales bacterium]